MRPCHPRRVLRFLAAAALVISVTAPTPVLGQLITDRPDFVEAARVVGAGVFQVETSLAGADDPGEGWTLTTPTLLRFGLAPRVELRLETEGYVRSGGEPDAARGVADLSLGVKLESGSVARGASALLVHVGLPTGSRGLRSDRADVSLRGVVEWDLGPRTSLGMMAGGVADHRARGGFRSGLAALVLGWSAGERVRLFAEGAAQRLARVEDGGNEVTANLGAVYVVSDDLQLDGAASMRVAGVGPHLAVTLGVSRRFR